MNLERKYILPIGCPQPVSYYSHGIHLGNILYSAGQTSRDPSGQLVGIGDVQKQANQAFQNLKLVLADAGMDFYDVVRLNIFLKTKNDLPKIVTTMKEYFNDHNPALTIAVVKGLAYQEYLLEVEAIAIKEEKIYE